MGLLISLLTENGTETDGVVDEKNVLHRILPQEKSNILSGIDWYGDTYFNRQQMMQFLPAWRELISRSQTPEEKALLVGVEELAVRCANGAHLYLKFIGD